MKVELDAKTNKFLIECLPSENDLLMSMPDRKFRKTSRIWAVPVLRRNVEYMEKHINNPVCFSKEALDVFNEKRRELQTPVAGESVWPEWYQFKNPPLEHQLRGLKKWFPLDSCAIFYEQGLGKTYTSINLVTAWRIANQIEAVLVFCPSSIKLVWDDELDKHCSIPTQVHSLTTGKYKQADKFIDNKTDFQWLVVGIEGMSQGNGSEYVRRFLAGRRVAIIVDESSNIKTPGKIRTDKIVKFGRSAAKRIILSGTSLTQGLEDFYTQFKFIDPEIIGYDSYYTYRAQFCITMSMCVGYDSRGNEKTIPKIIGYKNEDELMKLIRPYTERVEKADALDLPPKIFTNRYITMNPTQKRLYEEMKEDLFIELDDSSHEVTTVLEQMLRLQQITGGHYPWDNGEKIVPQAIPGRNPKVDELMSLMDEMSGKVIVWCQFRPEILLVSEALEKAGIGYVEFHGGCKEDEKRTAVTSFRTNPKIRVFLATHAAAYGLTITEASTAIYYSQGYSLERYSQSQDRIHRIGQGNSCNYIHLVCDKTIDTKVIKALADKKSIADMIYSALKDKNVPSAMDKLATVDDYFNSEADQALSWYEENGYT